MTTAQKFVVMKEMSFILFIIEKFSHKNLNYKTSIMQK